MRKLPLVIAALFIFVCVSKAQTLPSKITTFLNRSYAGWKQAPGACENRKWFLTGDFDGNGMKDYLVRVTTGKSSKARLNLIAFFGYDDKSYPAKQILDDRYTGEMLRSSFSVMRKGTKVQLGEGEGPTITLKNDGASQHICETDAVRTLVYESGKWRNIYE